MASLDDRQKRFLVQALACFDTPQQAADALFAEFGVKVERMQAASYDPTRPAGANLSQKWREIFDATRKKFLEEVSGIPIANQSFRLRSLHRMHEMALERRNVPLALATLEQAAKEMGGMFTNRRELSGPGGSPIPVRADVVQALTDEDLARIAAAGLAANADAGRGSG